MRVVNRTFLKDTTSSYVEIRIYIYIIIPRHLSVSHQEKMRDGDFIESSRGRWRESRIVAFYREPRQ